jgi:pyrimidine deaminase RibD-like protein
MDEHLQRQFMRLALLEGRKALPGCIPNPPVGCVLVRQGRVVASGHTNPPGKMHAEAMALSQLTGPLTDVTRVYISMLDPDTRNNGAGVEVLKRAGIEVSVGMLEELARHDLGPYLARKDNVLPRVP